MSHGLFDCIGLPLHGSDTATAFVHQHWGELRGYPMPGGWFNAVWRDPSGAEIVVNVHDSGEIEVVPGFAGGPTARITEVHSAEGTDTVVADVVDDDGTQVTRLCADSGQWRFLPPASSDATFEALITGLALDVHVYADRQAFNASPESDMGPLTTPQTLPNGTVMDRLRLGAESFIPAGMFQDPWTPMAVFSATVEHSWTKTVEATGGSFHVARVTTLGALGIYLCWPTDLGPLAEPGNTVYAEAYLTATLPELRRRHASDNN